MIKLMVLKLENKIYLQIKNFILDGSCVNTHHKSFFAGQSVPEDEQVDVRKAGTEDSLTATPSTSMIGSMTGSITISAEDKSAFEAEKMKLYQLLDDKVGELSIKVDLVHKR